MAVRVPRGGGAWTPDPAAEVGETSFINAADTCTAQYWQEVFDPPAGSDDLTASDAMLADVADSTPADVDEYAFDGRFAYTRGEDGTPAEGGVENRSLLMDSDDGAYLVSARVFTTIDHEASGMSNAYTLALVCDAGIDPMSVIDSLDEIAKVTVTLPSEVP